MKLTRIFICACSVFPFILGQQAAADEVILDDLIVDGSLCVGLECGIDEVFDFDTIKLKSDAPRIRFQDTSSTSSFPSTDWTMGVNKSDTDVSYFYIMDASSGIDVLKLSASENGGVALGVSAELINNAVTVGSAGNERRIMHVADGVEPTDAVNVLQLEQFQTVVNDGLGDLEAQMDSIISRIDSLETRLNNL
jgi:hypothetical protein